MQNRGMGLGAQGLGCGRVQNLTVSAGTHQRSKYRGVFRGMWLAVCAKIMREGRVGTVALGEAGKGVAYVCICFLFIILA